MQVIVNPVAGKGAGTRESARVRQLLHEQGIAFDLVYTERPGHAIELAQGASQNGYDAVVAVGGDGTANEVLNGPMRSQSRDERLPLGVLPIGTGNDFAHGDGTQLSHPKVQSMQARQVHVQAEGGLISHGDGEVFMIDGQRLEILPQQIDVICDEAASR